jgi:hypothetical protein
MADLHNFPTDVPNITVTLSGTEWLAIMLKLAGRANSAAAAAEADDAEAKILKQLGDAQ